MDLPPVSSPDPPPPPTFIVDDADAPFRSSQRLAVSPARDSGRPLASSASSPFLALPGMSDDAEPVGSTGDGVPNPFNFQTQVISTSPVKSNIGQRRGHRYKHSSISTQHQIFQEPPPRPPPVLPASLPMPTLREAWKSMSKDQRTRLYWTMCHLAVATYVFFKSEGSLAATALSHLVFFDAGSAAVCVAVDVLGNFEIWRRSTIRHPFGLERAEVLAGFALSIFLLFGGFDLVSHNLKHFLEGLGNHEAHHAHEHSSEEHSPFDLAAVAAIVSTLVSAYGLKNHARIAKVMRVSYIAALPSILSNPFHFLTLFVSGLLALFPLLSISMHVWMDRLICGIIAVAMFSLGMRVAVAQGLMLLMSYGGQNGNDGVTHVLREIESDSSVTRVDDAQFWQVHYGLCMANLKISVVRGYDEISIGKLRNRISSLIQNRLGEGYGAGGSVRWEVTMQVSTDGGM
ncbi:hypothetical protein NLU13_1677 [Sarocladium strictum]|uniref:Zinc transporter n=1 Tax=Sarocladium strictum TaxID=5046 RepID=A0AA39LCR0_SARSR|nr:hypothetical protein NLU13_1677 [Sarocladium strictum]